MIPFCVDCWVKSFPFSFNSIFHSHTNSLSLSLSPPSSCSPSPSPPPRWLRKSYPDSFRVFEANGTRLVFSYPYSQFQVSPTPSPFLPFVSLILNKLFCSTVYCSHVFSFPSSLSYSPSPTPLFWLGLISNPRFRAAPRDGDLLLAFFYFFYFIPLYCFIFFVVIFYSVCVP